MTVVNKVRTIKGLREDQYSIYYKGVVPDYTRPIRKNFLALFRSSQPKSQVQNVGGTKLLKSDSMKNITLISLKYVLLI